VYAETMSLETHQCHESGTNTEEGGGRVVPFYLQQGHGMKSLQREFVEKHPGTGVILSPRHCKHDQAQRYVVEISQAGGRVLFDPQFYNPRTSRESITEYPYWTTNIETFSTQDFTHDCAEDFALECWRIRYLS